MIKNKIIPQLLIIALMVLFTIDIFISINSFCSVSHTFAWISIVFSILISVFFEALLFLISKVEITGSDAKILYQIISYLLIIIMFIGWSLILNFSIINYNKIEAGSLFIKHLTSKVMNSFLYSFIAILYLKSFSIGVSKNDL